MIMADAPNGWFTSDLVFFGDSLSPATVMARGAAVGIPDLQSADTATRDAYYSGLGSWLNTLGSDEAVQFQWRVDSDYEEELELYRRQTIAQGARGWCRAVREERFLRYQRAMQEGRLRRERLEVWVGKRASTLPRRGVQTPEQFDNYLAQAAKSLGDRLEAFGARLPECSVKLMSDREHFQSWRSFLNPSLRMIGKIADATPDPRATILENCCPSEGITTRDSEGAVYFKYDGFYHGLLVLRQWPLETHFGIVWALTSALSGNYCFTVNCYPLNPQAEVKKTEIELKRLKRNVVRDEKESADTMAQKKRSKIAALQNGYARPFSVLPVIRVWDHSLESLQARLMAVKEAVVHMNGARYFQVEQPAAAKNLFFETLPGRLGGRYRDWDLFALGGADPTVCFLQDVLPLSASFTGHMSEGEALYEGNGGNLVGLRAFANNTPQHGVVIGTTRVGKSSKVIDYISQTDCFFKFRCIVEEGMSYATVVRLLGGESIVLNPDGAITLNYFDTQGAPLSQAQIALSAGLLAVMAGRAQDPEVNTDRKAMYGEYVNRLYNQAWNDWRNVDPERELEAARWAWLIERRRTELGETAALGSLEIWADLRQLSRDEPEKFAELKAAAREEELVRFLRRPESATLVRNVGVSMFSPADFPTHAALVESMQHTPMSHHDEREVMRLASRLRAWTRHGANGCLFDGVRNRDFNTRLLHFELGLLPEANRELKEAALYLLGNVVRQHVITLPRAWRKEGIYEEPSRYIGVGGAHELFSEMYAQMGKFGYRILPVTQQYSQLAQSELRPVIFGNSKQYWLFRQNDRADLDDLGDAIGLSNSVKEMVRNYSAPEYQSADPRYSEMAVWCQEGSGVSCGTVRNYATREMLYVSESSGQLFDGRMRVLSEYEDPVEGVLLEAEKLEMEKRGRKKAAKG
jgi:type IV secretion system protein TrbE